MFREEKNLKDSTTLGIAVKDSPLVISYTKTDKLVMALFMVTDMIDKDEPLRNKLRTLGAGIISDMHSMQYSYDKNAVSLMFEKVAGVMSFLDIALAVNIISEMNCNILKREFVELNQALKDSNFKPLNKQINLNEFLNSDIDSSMFFSDRRGVSIGHIGVQKGSTLMSALSKVGGFASVKNANTRPINIANTNTHSARIESFDIQKKQRQSEIINMIKLAGGGATIKDIKDRAHASPKQATLLASCGDKTLQRELVSMVRDGVLNKTGEKRWSRYFLKNA